ncbi:response regulator [Natronolimnobius sp. AArcel1]|uniref:response regulator n=1 Tax=Natronolimnobius sp. AArcel1 TaxID=1679093 RepID=UPI0013EE2653|nr:response regulator [Natronolimnobius sp. AArcel1]NGM71155.1 response regulator [Natronolimnobius sp. AArcel1]
MSSYTVLLVEDSDFLTTHVSDTLQTVHGFDVETVATAPEARSALEETGYDCLISSYELLEESGLDLAASINGDATPGMPDIPFILFTGNPLEPLVEDALEAGVTAFVSKSNHATGEMNVFANRIRLAIEAHR